MIVYLAGGMRSEWRERVKAEVPGHAYNDPCEHGLDAPKQYTAWDLAAIRASDVLLGYMEADNPSGVGLALEVGYAKAMGKMVIWVDGKAGRYFAIVRHTADIVFSTIDEATQFLRSLTRLTNFEVCDIIHK
jgi:nucleoside 2-deoxyribosyltransferase